MKLLSNYSSILLLIVMAALGTLLVFLPGIFLDQYQVAVELGPPWKHVYLVTVGLGSSLLAASLFLVVWRLWRNTVRKKKRRLLRDKNSSELSRSQQEEQIRQNFEEVGQFHQDPSLPTELRQELEPLTHRIVEKQTSQKLEIIAFGTINSGKSSLLNALAGQDIFAADAQGGTTVQRSEVPWPSMDKVVLVDTPGLGEVEGQQRASNAAEAAQHADLVLLVVDGPLRDSEFRLVDKLAQMEKRVLVCLNKDDWYSNQQRDSLLGQLADQLKKMIAPDDIVAVRSKGGSRPRIRVTDSGQEITETIDILPDISPLAKRMMKIVRRDGSDLLLANLLLQSRGLVEQARERVRQSLDRRAAEIVDKYMWGAGSAAALSPFPVVDLAVGCAISTKMVVDLARVYRQDIDMEVAIHLLGQLGKNLLAVLGTSAATPLIATTVASLLKTVPGVGTIAGGMLQGIVTALVTRWIGSIFIEYFKNEMEQPEGGLSGLARRQWQQMTTAEELRRLVGIARERLSENDPS